MPAHSLCVRNQKYSIRIFSLAKRSPRLFSNRTALDSQHSHSSWVSSVLRPPLTITIQLWNFVNAARCCDREFWRFYFDSNFISKQASWDEFFICGNDLHLNRNEHRPHHRIDRDRDRVRKHNKIFFIFCKDFIFFSLFCECGVVAIAVNFHGSDIIRSRLVKRYSIYCSVVHFIKTMTVIRGGWMGPFD